jgi:hypothetical protein
MYIALDAPLGAIRINGYEPKCPICFSLWNGEDTIPWVFPYCGHMICERCYLKYKLTTRKCHMCREKFRVRKQYVDKRRKRKKARKRTRRDINECDNN